MRRPGILRATMAAVALACVSTPVLAHGDHDARPLARDLQVGPHVVSLWQVYPDVGTAMTPHLIVLFDGVAAAPSGASVAVLVDGAPMAVRPSTTTGNGWETVDGIDVGDVVAVSIAEGGRTWDLAPVVVPPAPTSLIPMTELIYVSIFLTAATAWWVARRTARAWRRPSVVPAAPTLIIEGGMQR